MTLDRLVKISDVSAKSLRFEDGSKLTFEMCCLDFLNLRRIIGVTVDFNDLANLIDFTDNGKLNGYFGAPTKLNGCGALSAVVKVERPGAPTETLTLSHDKPEKDVVVTSDSAPLPKQVASPFGVFGDNILATEIVPTNAWAIAEQTMRRPVEQRARLRETCVPRQRAQPLAGTVVDPEEE